MPGLVHRAFIGIVAGLVALAVSGCACTIRLLSEVDATVVTLPDGQRIVTPGELRTSCSPFAEPYVLTVEPPGHRSFKVDIHATEGRLFRAIGAAFQRGGREVRFVPTEDRPPTSTGRRVSD